MHNLSEQAQDEAVVTLILNHAIDKLSSHSIKPSQLPVKMQIYFASLNNLSPITQVYFYKKLIRKKITIHYQPCLIIICSQTNWHPNMEITHIATYEIPLNNNINFDSQLFTEELFNEWFSNILQLPQIVNRFSQKQNIRELKQATFPRNQLLAWLIYLNQNLYSFIENIFRNIQHKLIALIYKL